MDRFTIDTRSGSRYIGLSIMHYGLRFYGPCTGQQCASGFPCMPFPQSGRNTYSSGRSFAASILIPGMNFTCDGTITRVTVGGMRRSGKNKKKLKLRVWKENATEPGIYHRSGKAIALALNNNMCNEKKKRCTLQLLMEEKQISVEPGDLLGIEVPRSNAADFELDSVPMPGLMNYIFRSNQHSMVNLSDRMDVIEEQPLIMFRLNRGDSGTIINFNTMRTYSEARGM